MNGSKDTEDLITLGRATFIFADQGCTKAADLAQLVSSLSKDERLREKASEILKLQEELRAINGIY